MHIVNAVKIRSISWFEMSTDYLKKVGSYDESDCCPYLGQAKVQRSKYVGVAVKQLYIILTMYLGQELN